MVNITDLFDISDNDVLTVYEQLKSRYDLVLTTTSELDEGFTIHSPIIVGKAHEQVIQLYVCDEMFILDVMDAEQSQGTHWHPHDIATAVKNIADFMDGKSDYPMYPFGKA
ncbi:MAG: hypothetical protein IKM34_01180 [Clostridia bacterium]|nr:hypothetical protein [Clostridia bacterium]